jgi:hypothetical protein
VFPDRPPLQYESDRRFSPHKRHQVAGVAELAANAIAAGHVTAQCHDAADARFGIGRQPLADAVVRLADAAQVRRGRAALGHDLGHGLQRAILRGAARAKSDRAELGLQGIQLLARGAQFFGALGRLGRKKFQA